MGRHLRPPTQEADRLGRRVVTSVGDRFGLGFALWRLDRPVHFRAERETGLVLLSGRARLASGAAEVEASRSSLFDQRPTTLMVSAGADVVVEPGTSGVELAMLEAEGGTPFEPRTWTPDEIRAEQRGQGSLHDAAHREVRTIVDDVDGPPGARLVIGEVVTLPGRWSSYPPHHHPQPEIYHYRFTQPQGYGHAELGDDVVKVRHEDTVEIAPGQTHAQCAAPGYGMWYLWVIRHLDDRRYVGPTFDPEHRWALDSSASHWWPLGE